MKPKKFFMSIKAITVLMLSILMFNSCASDDNFKDRVPDYTNAIIQSFKVGAKYAEINHTLGTITMTLPSGSDLTKVTPEIRLPEGATITPDANGTFDFSKGSVVFEIKSSDGANRKYTVSLGVYGDPRILSFSIGDKAGVIDQVTGKITVQVGSQDGDITKLAPNFVLSDGNTVDVSSGIAGDFSKPQVYTVLSNNGYTAKQYEVTVTQTAAPVISTFEINGVQGIIDNSTNSILVVLPLGADLTALKPTVTAPIGQSVSPSSGSAQDFSKGVVSYVVTNTENLKKTYAVSVQSIQPTKVAFIGNASSVNNISELDTKKAAQWAATTYGADFKYISLSSLNAAELADVKVLFFYYDNTGTTDLPDGGAMSANQVAILADFVKSGRNMFMAGLANTYLDDMGRIPFNPTTVGTGNGTDNIEYWGLNNTAGKPTNVTGHPAFAGITSTKINNALGDTFAWDFVPFLDNGFKEDHNAVWDLGGIPGLKEQHCSVARGAEFEKLTSCTILGDWQFIPDMCVVVAAEWHPVGAWKGKIISMGGSSYEWQTNDGRTNKFQSNIEKFTKNVIDYLLQ